LKHPTVEVVDHVDLDEDVIKTWQVYVPQWGDCWQDPRANLHIKDGAQFVRDSPDNYYDVIIEDSSDPWVIEDDGTATPLPSGVLYEEDHFCQLYRVLAPNGVLNLQVNTKKRLLFRILRRFWKLSRCFSCAIPHHKFHTLGRVVQHPIQY